MKITNKQIKKLEKRKEHVARKIKEHKEYVDLYEKEMSTINILLEGK